MTPNKIVNIILDNVGFTNSFILNKTIMEPSFGDGAFLVNIVQRIILEGQREEIHLSKIADIIKNNVYGIEKDEELYNKAIIRLDKLLLSYGIDKIDWTNNLICGDTLTEYEKFVGKMDYVVGNPPYVRIHNIPNEYRNVLKHFSFADGMNDLYVIFYELGIKMLNTEGKLGYISPNSFIKNTSQTNFRNYLIENKYISALYDFKASKLFADADTYTCICILDKNKKRNDDFVEYKEYQMYDLTLESKIAFKYFEEHLVGKAWILGSYDDIRFLEKNNTLPLKVRDIAVVQNGIATNKDSIYVVQVFCDKKLLNPYYGKHTDENRIVYFKDKLSVIREIESSILHRCVKASKYSGSCENTYIIFPYQEIRSGCIPLSEDGLLNNYPKAYAYLRAYKTELEARDIEKNSSWFLFGRSQGLQNSRFKKIVFKHIIKKSEPKIIPYILDEDVIVYSGMYTTMNSNNTLLSKTLLSDDLLKYIHKTFKSDDFARYCSMVGKDMSGGYVAVSTKMVQQYGIESDISGCSVAQP